MILLPRFLIPALLYLFFMYCQIVDFRKILFKSMVVFSNFAILYVKEKISK